MVAEEHQTPAGTEKPPGFGKPGFGRAPDRGAVFRDRKVESCIGLTGGLGVAFKDRDLGTVFIGKPARG